ncbi:polyphenol oxidase family protein [Candidatus Saccharibacteria bacterium]|nr:polyphenol oxidase family protein [Candidatus Saccharibacteria bacterium]
MQVVAPFGPGALIALSDKTDGNMKLPQNQQKIFNSLGATNIARIRTTYDRASYTDYFIANNHITTPNDGLATTQQIALFLTLADCLGIVFYDKAQKVLMLLHCGRRNLEQNGPQKAVQFLRTHYNVHPYNLHAWFSPSAGKDNYPLFAFDGKSIQEVAARQLLAEGLFSENIILSPIDTTTDSRYFSHSQGDTGSRHAICAILS